MVLRHTFSQQNLHLEASFVTVSDTGIRSSTCCRNLNGVNTQTVCQMTAQVALHTCKHALLNAVTKSTLPTRSNQHLNTYFYAPLFVLHFTKSYLPELLPPEVAIEAGHQEDLGILVRCCSAEVQQVREELRLIDRNHLFCRRSRGWFQGRRDFFDGTCTPGQDGISSRETE